MVDYRLTEEEIVELSRNGTRIRSLLDAQIEKVLQVQEQEQEKWLAEHPVTKNVPRFKNKEEANAIENTAGPTVLNATATYPLEPKTEV